MRDHAFLRVGLEIVLARVVDGTLVGVLEAETFLRAGALVAAFKGEALARVRLGATVDEAAGVAPLC